MPSEVGRNLTEAGSETAADLCNRKMIGKKR